MKICLQAFFRDVSTTSAVASADEGMLRSVWTELDYRIDICRVTKGSHTQRTFVTSSYKLKNMYHKTMLVFWLNH
jgi:hypothetical protein